MIVSIIKTETIQSDTWNGSNIAIFVQFALHQKKSKVYILGQSLTKILLLFREYFIFIEYFILQVQITVKWL